MTADVEGVIWIDGDSIRVFYANITHLGETATAQIVPYMPDHLSAEISALIFTATLTISSLKFSKTPTADFLYCDIRDKGWSFNLPSIDY